MKKKTYQSSQTYDHKSQYKTLIDEPSLTKPDMCLTIPEILQRYSSGRTVNVPVFDEYSGDASHLTGTDIRTMDISEVHDLLHTTKSNIEALELETRRRAKLKSDADLEASIISKHEARRLQATTIEPLPAYKQPELPMPPAK